MKINKTMYMCPNHPYTAVWDEDRQLFICRKCHCEFTEHQLIAEEIIVRLDALNRKHAKELNIEYKERDHSVLRQSILDYLAEYDRSDNA